MKLKLIRLIILVVFGLITIHLSAQEDYKAEIGVSGGGSYYLGDANSLPFKNMNLAFSGFFRYRFDPRLAARIELTDAKISVNGTQNTILATDFCGEFNFFDLEKSENKLFSKTFSPYIFAGVGVIQDANTEMSLPFGVGLKVKLANHWNLDVKWSNRLLFADNLEGTAFNTPYNNSNYLNGSNLLNNDLLSTLTIGISFDLWKRHCDCKNRE